MYRARWFLSPGLPSGAQGCTRQRLAGRVGARTQGPLVLTAAAAGPCPEPCEGALFWG